MVWPMGFLWPRSPVSKGAEPKSFTTAVNNILFWDNPVLGSAYPADDISAPRYRQIHPFFRPGRILRADDRRAKGRRPDPAGACPSPEKTAVFCRQIRGWRAPVGRRGIHQDSPRLGHGSSQTAGGLSDHWKGQIPTR